MTTQRTRFIQMLFFCFSLGLLLAGCIEPKNKDDAGAQMDGKITKDGTTNDGPRGDGPPADGPRPDTAQCPTSKVAWGSFTWDECPWQ